MSARTGGLILVQLLLDLSRAGARADRVLDAPTCDAWIDAVGRAPARRAASTCGWGRPVEGIDAARRPDRRRDRRRAGRCTPTTTSPRCRSRSCARCSRPSCARAEPRLNGLDRLVTRWMNGILFYLARTCRSSTATRSTSTPSGR